MSFTNIKRSAYFLLDGMRVNCDGTTILERKPHLNPKPNHYKYTGQRVHRIHNPELKGQAISDGKGWFK